MEKFIRSVARFIDNGFLKKRWGTHLSMNVRYFNIVTFLLCFFTALASLIIYCCGSNKSIPLLLLISSIFFLIIYILGNVTKKYNFFMILNTYAFNLIFLPALYFIGGEVKYGMWIYFIAGLLLSVLFIRGRAFIITIIIQPLYYFGIFFISYHYTFDAKSCSIIKILNSDSFWNSSQMFMILNFIIISISIGMLIKSLFVSYIDERKTALLLVKKLENLSLKDPLTGTYNRRYLYSHLDSAIKSSQNENIPLCIVMYDIDHFKNLNDTYGHVIGDEVLRGLSKILIDNCREYDIVSRYGGEEFIIVFPGIDEETAYQRGNKIRKEIENACFSLKITEPVTISGGVAAYKHGMDASKLINTADSNLYFAKNTGRNKIIWRNGATPPVNNKSEKQLSQTLERK